MDKFIESLITKTNSFQIKSLIGDRWWQKRKWGYCNWIIINCKQSTVCNSNMYLLQLWVRTGVSCRSWVISFCNHASCLSLSIITIMAYFDIAITTERSTHTAPISEVQCVWFHLKNHIQPSIRFLCIWTEIVAGDVWVKVSRHLQFILNIGFCENKCICRELTGLIWVNRLASSKQLLLRFAGLIW